MKLIYFSSVIISEFRVGLFLRRYRSVDLSKLLDFLMMIINTVIMFV
ncbi:hypothetical protein BVRB_3g066010 [Beta vulgaris subsp. vulgaris]|nr:hypothetical protein BVRB_3g066010 [Beta vulgaris subsp. vulgaris]